MERTRLELFTELTEDRARKLHALEQEYQTAVREEEHFRSAVMPFALNQLTNGEAQQLAQQFAEERRDRDNVFASRRATIQEAYWAKTRAMVGKPNQEEAARPMLALAC